MDPLSMAGVVFIFLCLAVMIVLALLSSRKIRKLKKKLLAVEARLEARERDA